MCPTLALSVALACLLALAPLGHTPRPGRQGGEARGKRAGDGRVAVEEDAGGGAAGGAPGLSPGEGEEAQGSDAARAVAAGRTVRWRRVRPGRDRNGER